ncbi:MAG: preprotein translocase subunit SecY [Candidatus Sungbacteria bacterium]|nr:preprotein translocase subunit SecY [Candidatus Sungbacteria bacterium]
MFERLQQILKISDLRKKILFVLAILVVFRVATAIPVPGVDAEALRQFLGGSQFFGLLNVFSGGALANLSIAMLGVGPYITGSIIMQLLGMIFPRLKEMQQEEGEAGRQKINQYSRLLTVPLGLLQAYGLLIILSRQNILPQLGLFGFLTNMIVITAGTMFLMWLGELITEKGIGNGISLMIFAGIISGLPASFGQFFFDIQNSPEKIPSYLVFAAIALVVIAGVVYISDAQRNIPVSYAKRIRGNRVYGGVSTHLPLRVNQAGVIPIIFAVSIVLFPGLIGSFLAGVPNAAVQAFSDFLIKMFNNQWIYGASYFVLVFVFTYFYTAVTFDPQAIADNLQKQGGFVLGIRPGRQTAEYLFSVQSFTIGGTALLIAVSVVLETLKQVQSQIVTYEYE